MNASPSILKFDNVTVPAGPHYETDLWNVSFGLNSGELLLGTH